MFQGVVFTRKTVCPRLWKMLKTLLDYFLGLPEIRGPLTQKSSGRCEKWESRPERSILSGEKGARVKNGSEG